MAFSSCSGGGGGLQGRSGALSLLGDRIRICTWLFANLGFVARGSWGCHVAKTTRLDQPPLLSRHLRPSSWRPVDRKPEPVQNGFVGLLMGFMGFVKYAKKLSNLPELPRRRLHTPFEGRSYAPAQSPELETGNRTGLGSQRVRIIQVRKLCKDFRLFTASPYLRKAL